MIADEVGWAPRAVARLDVVGILLKVLVENACYITRLCESARFQAIIGAERAAPIDFSS